ncbi:cation:proton antiporter [Methyloprofundus sp.]|uniref:cation:proton antiporter n=1 Tax=Methyloprofundus sp. TaxID=2020875 RepID=UPI003D0B2E35
MYVPLATLAAFVFLYSIVAGGLERTPINGALVFMAFGIALGPFGFGLPVGLGFMDMVVDRELLRSLAELTLGLVLFTDASNARLTVLKNSIRIPRRLLLVGLPLTILLGFGVGMLVFDGLTLLEIAILATMLAPTDAALGKAVVSNESVPSKVRESLNVESGLNDGICVPILLVFLALAASTGTGAEGESTSKLVLQLLTEQIGIGVGVGIGLTAVGSLLIRQCSGYGWISQSWRQLPVIALALTCFALAQILGGSGFIACFAGGLLFNWIAREHKHIKNTLLLAAEGTSDTLALITWVAFGGAVVGQAIGDFTWQVVLYSVLSLTVVRMLPVFLVLSGCGIRSDEKLFIGWFGPRGLASIVFGVMVIEKNLPGGDIITSTVVCTILFSIIAHGLSANPAIAVLIARLKQSGMSVVAENDG